MVTKEKLGSCVSWTLPPLAQEEGVSDSNSTGHDSNAWSVSMEGLALQAPDRLDTLPLRSTLQFTFEPAHAMATLFRALAGHTEVYSVRLPEADYTIAVKVSAADSCK